MAVIGSIRKRSGLLIIVIGGAMLAFILGDFLGQRLGGGGAGPQNVGEISGADISNIQFGQRLEHIKRQYEIYGSSASEDQLRRVAWNELVKENVYYKEIDNVGITVPLDELDDMMYGPGAISEFKDGDQYKNENGVFDPELVRQFYSNVFSSIATSYGQDISDVLYSREMDRITNRRLEDKYQDILKMGLYATEVEAKDEFNAKKGNMDLSFVYKTYASIPDSLVSYEESDLRAYFNEHKDESKFEQQEARSLTYVVFNADATAEDIQQLKGDFELMNESFKTTSNDSMFLIQNSDNRLYTINSYSEDEVPENLSEAFLQGDIGSVHGPFEEDGFLKTYKIINRLQLPDSARVRHILISSDASNDAQMKERADSISNAIKRGANFESLVTKYTDDPGSKENGGVYEWFPKGQMVPPFEKFSFEKNVGDVGVAKTTYGYHIIEVLGQKDKKNTVNYIELVRNIVPSTKTRDLAYSEASKFMFDLKAGSDFEELANELGYEVKEAKKINTRATTLPGLPESERVVSWAFSDLTNTGDISEPFEVANGFVVAILDRKTQKGTPELEDIREDIEVAVLNEKKAEMIREEWAGFTSLQDIADLEGTTVQKGSSVKFSTSSIANLGAEPDVIGTLAGSQEGNFWIIDGVAGVAAVTLDSTTGFAQEGDSFSSERVTVQNQLSSRVPSAMLNALNKAYDVEDNLYKFR